MRGAVRSESGLHSNHKHPTQRADDRCQNRETAHGRDDQGHAITDGSVGGVQLRDVDLRFMARFRVQLAHLSVESELKS